VKTIVVAAGLAIALLSAAPSAAAHPAYWSIGPAFDGTHLYRIDLYRFLDFQGINFHVRLTDPVTNEVLFQTRFAATDNYVDENEEWAIPYVADGAISGVDFHIEGFQSVSQVYAHGHYLGYTIVVMPNMGF
jgi:hypothetical protein